MWERYVSVHAKEKQEEVKYQVLWVWVSASVLVMGEDFWDAYEAI